MKFTLEIDLNDETVFAASEPNFEVTDSMRSEIVHYALMVTARKISGDQMYRRPMTEGPHEISILDPHTNHVRVGRWEISA